MSELGESREIGTRELQAHDIGSRAPGCCDIAQALGFRRRLGAEDDRQQVATAVERAECFGPVSRRRERAHESREQTRPGNASRPNLKARGFLERGCRELRRVHQLTLLEIQLLAHGQLHRDRTLTPGKVRDALGAFVRLETLVRRIGTLRNGQGHATIDVFGLQRTRRKANVDDLIEVRSAGDQVCEVEIGVGAKKNIGELLRRGTLARQLLRRR